jgi:RNA recognition motif-containing protein
VYLILLPTIVNIRRKLGTLPARIRKDMSKILYVGNLPFSATAADLTRPVKPHGEVISARIGLDKKTHKSRGFGFVEIPDRDAQAVIAALHGSKFLGRELKVNLSAPHPTRKDQSWKDRDRRDYEEIFEE